MTNLISRRWRLILLGLLLIATISPLSAGGRAALAFPIGDGGQPHKTATSYSSPLGYHLTWPDDWTVGTTSFQFGIELLTLTPSTDAQVQVLGIMNFGGDTDECISFLYNQYSQIADNGTMRRGSGSGSSAIGPGDDIAWGVWNFTITSGSQDIAERLYLGCQTLVPGQSVLAITLLADRDTYSDAADKVNGVLDDSLKIDAHDEVPDNFDQQIDERLGDIDDYYTRMMNDEHHDFRVPRAVDFSQPTKTPCQMQDPGGQLSNEQTQVIVPGTGPVYCPNNRTIYVDAPWTSTYLLPRHDNGIIAGVLAHESGHAVQDQLGLGSAYGQHTFDTEQQADCFSGAYLADAIGRGVYKDSDLKAYLDVISQAGGTEEGADHGTGQDRVNAVQTGVDEGFSGCLGA